VGKTTVCAALALAAAARGKRVLIAMCGAHERMSSILGTPPIGHDIMRVGDNIWATRIDADRAMEEYGELVIKVKTVARAVFDNRYTNAFFRAVPGLHDWAMLGKAWWHTTETRTDGSPRFDLVLFDAPATGHALDMLRVPKVILELVPPGVLRRDAEAAWELFQDDVLSGVVVVSLPEDMPVTETIEIVRALEADLHLPVVRVVVNGVLDPIFTRCEGEALIGSDGLLEVDIRYEDPGEHALAVAAHRAARESLQARCIARLEEELSTQLTLLPFLLDGAGTPEGVRVLASKLG
jgi:anion-transporting  ArsA/GET3 family ATPase